MNSSHRSSSRTTPQRMDISAEALRVLQKRLGRGASATCAAGPHKMLEQSYVDVGEAAASVLGLRDPSTAARKPSARQALLHQLRRLARQAKMSKPQPAPRLTADDGRSQKRTASKRMPSTSAQPPPSLEFLRQRGRDASRAKGMPARPPLPITAQREKTGHPSHQGRLRSQKTRPEHKPAERLVLALLSSTGSRWVSAT